MNIKYLAPLCSRCVMRGKPGDPGGTFLDELKAGLGYTFIHSSCKNPIIQRQNCQCSVFDEI